MPRVRQAGSVEPPQSVAKSVPAWNRTQPAQTTVSPASATMNAIASGSAVRSPSRSPAKGCEASPQTARACASIRSKSPLAHLTERNPFRKPRLGRDPLDRCDQHGLLLFGHEASGAQPCGEVRRPIVSAKLPLEPLAAPREEVNLPPDQLVERPALDSAEIAVADETLPIAEPEETEERPVTLTRYTGR